MTVKAQSGRVAQRGVQIETKQPSGRGSAVLSWLRAFFFTDPLICFYTFVCGAFSLSGSLFDPHGSWQHRCAQIWASLILRTGGIRVKARGLENIPRDGTVIFCSNHPSAMDIPILLATLPVQFRFVAKRSLFSIPFLGWHLWRSGHVPVERDRPHKAFRSLDQAADRIRGGRPVVLFPEGTRPREAGVGQFKKGSFYLAVKSGAPLVPVTISGSRTILKPDSLHVRPGSVEVTIHPPIPTSGLTLDAVEALSESVRQQILSCFQIP